MTSGDFRPRRYAVSPYVMIAHIYRLQASCGIGTTRHPVRTQFGRFDLSEPVPIARLAQLGRTLPSELSVAILLRRTRI